MHFDYDYRNELGLERPIPSLQLDDDEMRRLKELIEFSKTMTVENPVIKFTKDVKDCKLDNKSDADFEKLVHMINRISVFWTDENKGFIPSARMVYKVACNGTKGKEAYVQPELDGTTKDTNMFLLLERLYAYTLWHYKTDTEIDATIDNLFDIENAICIELFKQKNEIDTLEHLVKSCVIVHHDEELKDEKKKKEIERNKEIYGEQYMDGFTLLKDSTSQSFKNIKKSIESSLSIHEKLRDTLMHLKQLSTVIDKTDNPSYNIPEKEEDLPQKGYKIIQYAKSPYKKDTDGIL